MEEEREEFFKLDYIDRRIAFWLMDNSPEELRAWTREIRIDYLRNSIVVNAEKLFKELIDEVKG